MESMTTQDFSILKEAAALDAYALLCTFLTAVPPASLDLRALITAFMTSKNTSESKGFWTLVRAALFTNHVPLYSALLKDESPMDCVAELCQADLMTDNPQLPLVLSALQGISFPGAHTDTPSVRTLFMNRFLALACGKKGVLKAVVLANVTQWYTIAFNALQTPKLRLWLMMFTYSTYGFLPHRSPMDGFDLHPFRPTLDGADYASFGTTLGAPRVFYDMFHSPEEDLFFGHGSAERFAYVARLWHHLGKPVKELEYSAGLFDVIHRRFEKYGFVSNDEAVLEFATTVFWFSAFSVLEANCEWPVNTAYHACALLERFRRVQPHLLKARTLQACLKYLPGRIYGTDYEYWISEALAQKIFSIRADDCADDEDLANLADAEHALELLFMHCTAVQNSVFYLNPRGFTFRKHLQSILDPHVAWMQFPSRRAWILACCI